MPESRTDELLRHAGFVRSLARSLLRQESDVADAVQETWAAALANPPEPSRPPRPWLARVVRNVAFRLHRDRERRLRRELRAAKSESTETTAERAAREESLRAVVDAVLALDEPYRETILLHYYEGLSYKEIAARCGIGVEAVRIRLKRGRAVMRARLDRRGTGGWAPALAALIGTEHARAPLTTTGAVVMGTKMKIGAGVALILLLAGMLVMRSDATSAPPTRSASAPRETPIPVAGASRDAGENEVDPRVPAERNIERPKTGPVRIFGFVRTEEGAPIENATVSARFEGGASTTTGRDGGYSLDSLPYGAYALEASAPGRAAQFRNAQLTKRTARVDFELHGAATIFGRFLDHHGEPVAGVYLDGRLAEDQGTRIQPVRSDEQGRFRIRDARAGRWWIRILPPENVIGRRSILVSGEESPLKLRLFRPEPGQTRLRIEVVEAGTNAPIALDERVCTLYRVNESGDLHAAPRTVEGSTVRCVGLPAGTWKFRAKSARGRIDRTIRIAAGATEVLERIEIGAGGEIHGRAVVRSADALPQELVLTTRPVHEGRWIVNGKERPSTGGFAVLAKDAGYEFQLDRVRSGMPIDIVLEADGFFGRARTKVDPGGLERITIPVVPAGRLCIRIDKGIRTRPVRAGCWPKGKPEWKEWVALRKKDRWTFSVPAGAVRWRVAYRDHLSGEPVVRSGEVEVKPGEVIVVDSRAG